MGRTATPRETREAAPVGATIEWTIHGWPHKGDTLVRRGMVVNYERWSEGSGRTGALAMCCQALPRKFPRQPYDFVVPVSSEHWQVVT